MPLVADGFRNLSKWETIDPLWFESINEIPSQELAIINSDDDWVPMRFPVDSLLFLINISVEGVATEKTISPDTEDVIEVTIEEWKFSDKKIYDNLRPSSQSW